VEFFDISFLKDFASNALATFLGAILGIPIALWINKHQEKSSEKERKQKILSLLFEELIINLTQLSGWHKNKRKKVETTMMGPFLRDESWRAFSDGGELEWIKDPKLISELANAYSYIRTLQQLTERYTNLIFMSEGNKNTIALNELWQTIEKGIPETMDIVQTALKAIAKEKDA